MGKVSLLMNENKGKTLVLIAQFVVDEVSHCVTISFAGCWHICSCVSTTPPNLKLVRNFETENEQLVGK